MLLATVKWFNGRKGFGFLLDGGDREIFVHYSAIKTEGFRSLEEGEEVECEVVDTPKGRHALSVRPLRWTGNATKELARPAMDGEGI